METTILDHACHQIYRQYKEFSGVRPSCSNLPAGGCILIFHANVKTNDGKDLSRDLRVTLDSKGRIVKISTSR
jgi:hypothetical protein